MKNILICYNNVIEGGVSMLENLSDINNRYSGEWVFMVNCLSDDAGNILKGEVVLHSRSRDEVFREMIKYREHPSMFSFRFAGKIPEGVNVLL